MSLSSRFCDLLPSSDTASPFTWTSPLSLHDALPISPENLTPALHPAGVRSCRRLSQGKTRNFLPRCKPGQVVIFLMFRTVVHQKFCRTKGVRNHHCCCKRTAARCQFGYDDAVCICRKTVATILLRDDETKKPVHLDIVPHLLG